MSPIDHKHTLYMNAACLVHEWIYFTTYNSNWLYRLNIETNTLEALHLLRDTKAGMKFSGLYYYKDMIWMIPWSADYIYIYDLLHARLEQLTLPIELSEYNDINTFRKSMIQGKYLWLLPYRYQGIIRIDLEERVYKIYHDFPINTSFDTAKKMNFKMMTLYENSLYLFNDACNMSIKLSTETGVMTEWKEGFNQSFGVISSNTLFTSPVNKYDPIKRIPLGDNQNMEYLDLPNNIWLSQPQYIYCYWYPIKLGNRIFYMTHEAKGLIMMNTETEQIHIIDLDISNYETLRQSKNYAVYDILPYEDGFLIIPYQGNKVVLIDCNGIIIKEFILEDDRQSLTQVIAESYSFHLEQYINSISSIDMKQVTWNNEEYLENQENKEIGYRINQKIIEGIE